MSLTAGQRRIAAAAAGAAREVPGVAYLSPGAARRLRRALTRSEAAGAGEESAGVRVTPYGDRAGWTVEVSLAVFAGHQAARVARQVRAGVTAAVREADGDRAECRVAVRVTVTAVV
ncbi:Asp23/Gls24 family envelope stress response protein [Streptomyces sp. NPDC018031]|uniref:Asp23/Gls24 family envelope stress response protein n=1 Tax=Streptomyces sp. NPDC018031 TaxID=3365033 RepID=UPI0037A80E22